MKECKTINVWNPKISNEEIKYQIENYSDLNFMVSYRGILVYVFVLSWIFGAIFSFGILRLPIEILFYSIIFYLPLIYFVYFGKKLAYLILLIIIILDGVSMIHFSINADYGQGGIIGQLCLKYVLLISLYKSFCVENQRHKNNT